MNLHRIAVPIAAVLILSACGGPPDTGPDAEPAPPTDVQAVPGNGYVRVSWTDRSDDETGFAVYRTVEALAGSNADAVDPARRTSMLAATEVGRTAADVTRFHDLTADPEASYRYAVAALGATPGSPTEAVGDPTTATAVELRVDLATTGPEAALNDAALQRYLADRPAISVTRVDLPALSDDRYGYYRTLFESGTYDLDLVRLDVVWTGLFGGDLADLSQLTVADAADGHLQSLIDNATVDDRLVAFPWFVDIGLLYYRTDLLADYGYAGPPTSWDELETMATVIQEGERSAGNADFWGYVWQGASYEGLTCNALEWIASNGGGTIVSSDGVITVDNPAAAAIVQQAAGWVGTISPTDVTDFAEESARNVFQSGNAAFMRNWPYAYSLGQAEGSAVAGLFEVAPLPAGDGGRSAATLGGWNVGVPSASPNAEASADLAVFLTSAEEQTIRAEQGYWPSRPDLYDDPELMAAQPIAEVLGAAFADAVARPSSPTGADYVEASSALYTAVHRVLNGEQAAADALSQAATEIQGITGLPTGAP